MIKANGSFQLLKQNYLFATIAEKVSEFQAKYPEKDVIKLGIGDVTRPLSPTIYQAMQKALLEMTDAKTFQGYPPSGGFDFLKAAIKKSYAELNVSLEESEIFVSDGAKSDCANFTDIFGSGNILAITDPVYPVYFDSNILAGHGGKQEAGGEFSKIRLMPCVAENDFVPEIPKRKVDIIYLCSPNNPTGKAFTYDQLKVWVDYALKNEALILFDGAYEAYITEDDKPRSIYEIEGAKGCAVEFRSFSKNAGFTGVRCAYTVVPKGIRGRIKEGGTVSLNKMWARRHATKFNGVTYVIQRGAEACFSPEGQSEIQGHIDYYMANAKAIKACFKDMGYDVYGGTNSPYVWLKTPNSMDSWGFFDHLLNDFSIVGTPGSGFGSCGEGYFRLTGFGTKEKTAEAIARIKK